MKVPFRGRDAHTKEVAMDMLTRYVVGESIESISTSYGLEQTATGFVKA